MNATTTPFPLPISAFSPPDAPRPLTTDHRPLTSQFRLWTLDFGLWTSPFLLSTFCFLLFPCSSLSAAEFLPPNNPLPATNAPAVSSPVVSSPVVSGLVVSGPPSGPIPQLSTLNPQPSAPPSTLNPQPRTPNPLSAGGEGRGEVAPKPSTLNPQLTAGFITMDTMDDKHKLALGDQLTFRIVEDQEDPNEKMEPKPMLVGDRGEVEVPYIGPFPAVGKTSKQLAREIKTELEKKYYYQATVLISLALLSKTTGKVYVLGEVRLTGPVDMPGDEVLTVGKAILRAGGFTTYSDKRHVKVTRKGDGASAKSQTTVVDVADILEKGKIDKDLTVETGDVIFVPSRLINL